MPEINQYSLDHRELIELLIKHIGLHEGRWMLSVSFGISSGNFGPPEQMLPGVVMGVQNLGLQRATPTAPDELTLDASVVNPLKAARKRRAPKRKVASGRKKNT